ncbi:MAG: hypothetical protein PF440_07275 [Thiomicrorhabdus sp.]|jgi:hypothetical protein|nr:hypothetical protein [Thiomicrorhabdus sp.]
MDINYAKDKLRLLVRDIDEYNDDEFWIQMSRIAYWSTTGQPNAEELLQERDLYLTELSNIQQMCIGEIAMGYKLDANSIGEGIYTVTKVDSETLANQLKEQKS